MKLLDKIIYNKEKKRFKKQLLALNNKIYEFQLLKKALEQKYPNSVRVETLERGIKNLSSLKISFESQFDFFLSTEGYLTRFKAQKKDFATFS